MWIPGYTNAKRNDLAGKDQNLYLAYQSASKTIKFKNSSPNSNKNLLNLRYSDLTSFTDLLTSPPSKFSP